MGHALQQLDRNQGQKLPYSIQPLSFPPPKIICGNSLPSLFQVSLGQLLETRLKEVSPSFLHHFFCSLALVRDLGWSWLSPPFTPNPACCKFQLDLHPPGMPRSNGLTPARIPRRSGDSPKKSSSNERNAQRERRGEEGTTSKKKKKKNLKKKKWAVTSGLA